MVYICGGVHVPGLWAIGLRGGLKGFKMHIHGWAPEWYDFSRTWGF